MPETVISEEGTAPSPQSQGLLQRLTSAQEWEGAWRRGIWDRIAPAGYEADRYARSYSAAGLGSYADGYADYSAKIMQGLRWDLTTGQWTSGDGTTIGAAVPPSNVTYMEAQGHTAEGPLGRLGWALSVPTAFGHSLIDDFTPGDLGQLLADAPGPVRTGVDIAGLGTITGPVRLGARGVSRFGGAAGDAVGAAGRGIGSAASSVGGFIGGLFGRGSNTADDALEAALAARVADTPYTREALTGSALGTRGTRSARVADNPYAREALTGSALNPAAARSRGPASSPAGRFGRVADTPAAREALTGSALNPAAARSMGTASRVRSTGTRTVRAADDAVAAAVDASRASRLANAVTGSRAARGAASAARGAGRAAVRYPGAAARALIAAADGRSAPQGDIGFAPQPLFDVPSQLALADLLSGAGTGGGGGGSSTALRDGRVQEVLDSMLGDQWTNQRSADFDAFAERINDIADRSGSEFVRELAGIGEANIANTRFWADQQAAGEPARLRGASALAAAEDAAARQSAAEASQRRMREMVFAAQLDQANNPPNWAIQFGNDLPVAYNRHLDNLIADGSVVEGSAEHAALANLGNAYNNIGLRQRLGDDNALGNFYAKEQAAILEALSQDPVAGPALGNVAPFIDDFDNQIVAEAQRRIAGG